MSEPSRIETALRAEADKPDAVPLALPQLPLIANYYFQSEKLEAYSYALSDLLCWLDGFTAAGGVYSPQTQETLRDLNCAIKSVQQKQACGDSYSHKQPKKQNE